MFRQHCRSQADAWVAVSFLVHKSETQHLGRDLMCGQAMGEDLREEERLKF